jgi:hypothetical protein
MKERPWNDRNLTLEVQFLVVTTSSGVADCSSKALRCFPGEEILSFGGARKLVPLDVTGITVQDFN